MGNILETDSSVSSENEAENNPVTEVRTEGDGMEAEKTANGAVVSDNAALPAQNPVVSPVTSSNELNLSAVQEIQRKHALMEETVKNLEGAHQRQSLVSESPRQLPPREKLIALKPPKLTDKNNPESCSPYDRVLSASTKQSKEPKFVPYEPYKGATRSMVEDVKCHSRKASYSSTLSVGSVESSKIESSSGVIVPYPNADKKMDTSASPAKSRAQKNSEKENNINQNHSVMLFKERLRIQEKDITELRNENTRLKKMLVDSLAGFGSPPSSSSVVFSPGAHPSFQLGSNGNSFSESVDNLTDEIEVWRSKFLSSCVLVEQLTKENQEWKSRSSSAAELFREIKHTSEVSLTPLLFNKINSWLHHFSQEPSKVLGEAEENEIDIYNHDILKNTSGPPSV